MTENDGVRTPPKLRQIWPPIESGEQPRLGSRRDAKLRKVSDLLAWRSLRAEVLGCNLLNDPAWDLLLHVYAAELANRPVTLLELASALRINASSVHRWARALEEEGLVELGQSPDPASGSLRLTDRGIGGMHALFELLPIGSPSSSLSA